MLTKHRFYTAISMALTFFIYLGCSPAKEKNETTIHVEGNKWVNETTLLAIFTNESKKSFEYQIERGDMICYDEISQVRENPRFQWYYFPEEYIINLEPGETQEHELFVVCGKRSLPRAPAKGSYTIVKDLPESSFSKEGFKDLISSWKNDIETERIDRSKTVLQWAIWAQSGSSFEELALIERQLNDGTNSETLLRIGSEVHEVLLEAGLNDVAEGWEKGLGKYLGLGLPPESVSKYNLLIKQEVCTIDLDIFDGQGDNSAVGKAPGELENLEETRGAYTVANLNDTDGDDTVDKADNSVIAGERNEVDLIRLVLNPPIPAAMGNVKLEITNDNVAVKLWKSSTKAGGEETRREFPINELPLTLWLEGLKASAAVRDITVKLSYPAGGCEDNAMVTLIWADIPQALHDRGDVLWPQMPARLSGNLNRVGGTGLQPLNALHAGNGIAFRSLLKPPGIQNETDVNFDFTRQMKRTWKYKTGNTTIREHAIDWPSPSLTSNAIELPNDDRGNGDESRTPTGEPAFYSTDAPGLAHNGVMAATYSDYWYRGNFCEFVRVNFTRRPVGRNVLDGSRASPKLSWTMGHHFRSRNIPPDDLWFRSTADAAEGFVNFIKTGHSTLAITGF